MPPYLLPSTTPALLVLADGSVFEGRAIGACGSAVGEVVFNTAMTGYQEILTDPSYARQIVTLTYPHIGNTGTNAEDEECGEIWAAGLVIRDLPLLASSFRKEQSLEEYLCSRNIVGIADIDTRRLTRLLRDKGAQDGCIVAGDSVSKEFDKDGVLKKSGNLLASRAWTWPGWSPPKSPICSMRAPGNWARGTGPLRSNRSKWWPTTSG